MKDKFTYTLIFKLLKIKDTKRTLKAAREKRHYIEEQRFKSPQTLHQKPWSWKTQSNVNKARRRRKKPANQGSISSENMFQIGKQIKTFSF